MQYITHTINGIDGTQAQLFGYCIDNSDEVDPQRRRPTVLILPGGGYAMTSDREAEPIALKFVGAGYNAFVLRYSVSPSLYPVALCEAAQAMTLIRTHADKWHVDAERVGVIGFSAGGHLAGNLATTAGDADLTAHGFNPDKVRPNALLLAYPVLSSGEFAHRGSFDNLLGPQANDPQKLQELSIDKHVDTSTPPTFIWHTMTDDVVPVENSLLFIQACKNAGVPVEAHLFSEGGHGLALANEETAWGGRGNIFPSIQPWIDLAIAWFGRL